MRRFRFSCGATSLILAAVLLALTTRGPILTPANIMLLAAVLVTGNAWAWLCVDARSQRRCDRINRRMSTMLAAHDLDQVTAAITAYRDKKGDQ